ncbi:MAG: hypothetical protein ACUVQZ_05165 [Candidatus Caldatribacteriaceae bacterium]
MPYFLAIDPGREKVGMAVLSSEGKVQWMGIVSLVDLERKIQGLASHFSFQEVVIGDSTGKEEVIEVVERLRYRIALVDEKHSSEEARTLYFQERFSFFWRKILPLSLFFPRHPYDDWQAVVIGLRRLQIREGETLGK